MVAATPAVRPRKRILRKRPPKAHPFLPRRLQTPIFLVWLRRSHGWLGIWGAVAGILFGLTTIAMVHANIFRTGEDTQTVVQLPVNGAAIASVDDLGAFVKAELGLRTEWRQPRNAPPVVTLAESGTAEGVETAGTAATGAMGAMGGGGRRGGGAVGAQSNQPVFVTQFTSPQRTLDLRYVAGNEYIQIVDTERGFFETMNRLHRGNGAQLGWTLLGDAFSGALIVLALSGVLLWSRMDGPRLLAIGLGSAGLLAVVYFGLAGA